MSLAIVMCVLWLGLVITIYTAKGLTKTSGNRWIVFGLFTILTTFMAFKLLGTDSYALINMTIVMEPLILCTLVGMASIKLRGKKDHFSSLCAAVCYILISGAFMAYGTWATKDMVYWGDNFKDTMIYLHVGIVLGCLMFLITLNQSAKYNSRFSAMSKGEHMSCAFGIYLEIVICVSLALCIIFA